MMTKYHILIVEDEPAIAEVLCAYCTAAGYSIKHLSTGQGVLAYIKENNVDLVLLDLMLPDIDGVTLCKETRLFSQVPIIMVTAKNEEIDRLIGLEIGADDYICKPFSPREVIARIKVILRRAGNLSDKIIRQSGFELDMHKFSVTLHNQPLDLTPIEFKILERFLANISRVFSRQEIMDAVYDGFEEISDRNIDTHIKNIRKKIAAVSADLNPIVSVYGVGYKMEC
ncbi:response regulator [Psychromonas aquimarina]|uniref:response regulator n=1 Tax=Psychromonas aquimarina TaxID=444919 RepID=UPI00040302FE|nr:response regulator [Psychromonas aquimarina]